MCPCEKIKLNGYVHFYANYQAICIIEEPGKGQSVLKAYERKHHFEKNISWKWIILKTISRGIAGI